MNYTDFTKVQISAKIYWGFNIKISNNKIIIMSEQEIIEEIKNSMKIFFKIHGLEELKQGIEKLNLHIHDRPALGQIIYVCDHE